MLNVHNCRHWRTLITIDGGGIGSKNVLERSEIRSNLHFFESVLRIRTAILKTFAYLCSGFWKSESVALVMNSTFTQESPPIRGRTQSLTEVLEEMFGYNPNEMDEERSGRKNTTEVQNTK